MDDYLDPDAPGSLPWDMVESRPRRPASTFRYDLETQFPGPLNPAWPTLAVAAGAGALTFGIGAAVYMRRHDWLRFMVCVALFCGCSYGLYRILS